MPALGDFYKNGVPGGANKLLSEQSTAFINALADAVRASFVKTPEDFGAIGNGVADDTAALQAGIDWCVEHSRPLMLTGGKIYKLSSWVQVGSGDAFATVKVFSQTPCHVGLSVPAVIYQSNGAMPAMTIQGARGVELIGIAFRGINTAPVPIVPAPDVEDYLSVGVSNTRWAPHCGLAIDPFSGDGSAQGINGYGGASYGQFSSIGIYVKNCTFENFAVGAMSVAVPGNADSVYYTDCNFVYNAVGMATCQTQNRATHLTNCLYSNLHTAIDSKTYGSRNGCAPKIYGGEGVVCHRVFNVTTSFESLYAAGLYIEAVSSLGTISGTEPALFEACIFNLAGLVERTYFPIVHGSITTLQARFLGCSLTTEQPFLNLIGPSLGGTLVFDQCTLTCPNEPTVHYQVCSRIKGGYQRVFVRDSKIGAEGSAGRRTANESVDLTFAGYHVGLSQCSRWIRTGGQSAGNLDQEMIVRLAYGEWKAPSMTVSAINWSDDTLTFTAVAGEFMQDDILYWPVRRYIGGVGSPDVDFALADGVVSYIPALKVTSVIGTAVTAVAQGEVEELETEADVFNTIYVALRDWAPNTALVGTWTTASATITISPTYGGLLTGDFVLAAAGLPSIVRVVSNNGAGSVVLSKNPTSNRTNEPIYCSKLSAL